jgi:hypothetical protein
MPNQSQHQDTYAVRGEDPKELATTPKLCGDTVKLLSGASLPLLECGKLVVPYGMVVRPEDLAADDEVLARFALACAVAAG